MWKSIHYHYQPGRKDNEDVHIIQKKLMKLAKQEDIAQYGYRKLGEKIGVDHPQKVKHHLSKLINDGFLYRTVRGELKVSTPESSTGKMLSIPILGEANCGQPLAYADDTIHGYLQLSPRLVNMKKVKELFVVKASGDSMNQASVHGKQIDDGDYVVVDSSVEVPSNGDYVVSSVEGLANIKCFKKMLLIRSSGLSHNPLAPARQSLSIPTISKAIAFTVRSSTLSKPKAAKIVLWKNRVK